MKIVTICGAGIGTSGILKVNAERALQRLGLSATVVAAVEAIGPTYADVIVVENYFDGDELAVKLEAALG